MNTKQSAIERLKQANICSHCNGTGKIITSMAIAMDISIYGEPCITCSGTGYKIDPALINAAIAEAEKNAQGATDRVYDNIGRSERKYDSFEDWQEKEGTKL